MIHEKMLAMRQPPKRTIYAIAASIVFTLFLYHWRIGYNGAHLKGSAPASSLLGDIQNKTLGFENIFVVSLPERTDRRDRIVLQAALSDLSIEFVDGPRGKDISDKAFLRMPDKERMADGPLGCWRAHLNAVHEIVKRNLSSALILEDDVDWDVRIKGQLHDLALSSQVLIQPLAHSLGRFADPTYPVPADDFKDAVPDLDLQDLPETQSPSISPYGNDWDVLWLGHCGQTFPTPDSKIPRGRVVHKDDITTPKKHYLWTFIQPFRLVDDYPEHTRVVHHAQEGVCALGYAVSQAGARKLLQEVALKEVQDAVDILLRFFCDGIKGRRHHNCLTIQPGLFHHHRPIGAHSAASNIGNHGDGFHDKASSDGIRWSVRLNADALLEGNPVMWDQLPD